jgi:hypothetical protein
VDLKFLINSILIAIIMTFFVVISYHCLRKFIKIRFAINKIDSYIGSFWLKFKTIKAPIVDPFYMFKFYNLFFHY